MEGCGLEKSLHILVQVLYWIYDLQWSYLGLWLCGLSFCFLNGAFLKQLYWDRMDMQWTVFKVFSLTCFHICAHSWGYRYNENEGPIDPSAPGSVLMRLCNRPLTSLTSLPAPPSGTPCSVFCCLISLHFLGLYMNRTKQYLRGSFGWLLYSASSFWALSMLLPVPVAQLLWLLHSIPWLGRPHIPAWYLIPLQKKWLILNSRHWYIRRPFCLSLLLTVITFAIWKF